MNWTWSDALLLLSIISKDKNGTDLRGVISTGDYVNHAIFSFDELKSGLEKLIAINYVFIEQNRFFTTPKFNREYKKLKVPKAMLKAVDQLYEVLKVKPIDETKLNSISAEIISEQIIKNAINEYVKGF